MNNYRKISELNDTKCGVLETNGQRYRNSNPSSSAKKRLTAFVVRRFFVLSEGFEPISMQPAGGRLRPSVQKLVATFILSNPSSSAKKRLTAFAVGRFFASATA